MTLHVKEGGTWREVDQPFANVGGTWKTVREVHVKHGGSWRLAHTTPYTEYNLGSYVLEQNIGEDESGTYTVPTGQGIAYIQIYVEGQAGGGGGGVYTPTYYPCVNGSVPVGSHYPGGPTTTTKVGIGGFGGLGGTITCIHRVYDGDYVSWNGYSDGPANGGGGAGYELSVREGNYAYYSYTSGSHNATTGDNGFMVQCNVRNSAGYSKSQLWAGGGRGGPGANINNSATCVGPGIHNFSQGEARGFTISTTNGVYGASGQASNEVVAGSGAISVVQGDGTLARGVGGNVGYSVANNGDGGAAQNIGQVKIKLYTPDKY